jgi:hypothetical protein
VAATDGRVMQLQQQRAALSATLLDLDGRCKSTAAQQEELRAALERTASDRYRLLLATSRQQRLAKRCAAPWLASEALPA